LAKVIFRVDEGFEMTIAELQEILDRLSSWRKKELFEAQFQAENAKNKQASMYLCRAWVLVMYAHCDNFLKEASKNYLLFSKDNKLSFCQPHYLWLALKGKNNLTEGANDKYWSFNEFSFMNQWEMMDDKLISEIFDKRSFNYKSLRFVCDWVTQVDFNHSDLIDFCDKMKKKRDAIAHGEEAFVNDIEDCKHWHFNTIKFISSFKNALLDAAESSLSSTG
jgi:hypothetical protein